MDTNISYTLVGAFVIFLIAAIVMTIIWLSAGFSVVPYSTYIMNSQESVSGLNVDAAVEYNGVNVGAVKSVELNKTDPHLVTVLLNIKSSTPVTRGTVATLTSRGITGVAFVALKDNGKDPRPLIAEPGQPYPVIPTTPSLFMRLDHALRSLTNNFESIAHSIHDLLNKDNLRFIRDTLKSLDQVTSNLAGNNKRLNLIFENTSNAMQQLTPMIKTMNSQTLPVTYEMLNNMNNAARNLNDVSIQLKQNPSILIRGAATAPLGPGERRR
jgi:phospholipid/cholesterol/gamma-HCH transport system substrate-binding protein